MNGNEKVPRCYPFCSPRKDEGPVTLVLRGSQLIEGRVNRRANLNGTARIMGGADLQDWFQRIHSEGDTVEVRIRTPERLILG